MESLRRPEMVISVATAAGLLGSTFISYKKIGDLNARLEETNIKVAKALTGVNVAQGKFETLANDVKRLNSYTSSHVKELLNRTEDASDSIDQLQFVVEEILKTIKAKLDVDVAREPPRYGRRPALKKSKPTKPSRAARRSEEDEEDDEENEEEESEEERPKRGKKKPLVGAKKAKKRPAAVDSAEEEEGEEDQADEDEDSVAASIAAARAAKKHR